MRTLAAPLLGGVLIGGASRRMGRPKTTIVLGGRTLVERAVAALTPHVSEVVLLGRAPLPNAMGSLRRIGDAPGVPGPLAGMLAALRSHDAAAWVFAPCDLPLISPEAVGWLIRQRRAPFLAIVPTLDGQTHEPLFAIYEPAARGAFERIVLTDDAAPWKIVRAAPTRVVRPPRSLRPAWHNANSPGDLPAGIE